MKQIQAIFVVVLLFPVASINFSWDDLRVSNDERVGKPGFWDKLFSGQYGLDRIYSSGKVSIKIWDLNLKSSSVSADFQQIIAKIDEGSISQLIKDYPTADVTLLYSDSTYTYVMIEEKMSLIAQRYWNRLFGKTKTIADESYVHQISLNQEMTLINPLETADYADESDICRTTYDLCEDYDILDLPYTGKGIKIAVLDTGVKLEHLGFSNTSTGYNTTIYNESFCAGEDWQDRNGHGTHCIGIIAGQDTYVNGVRMRGVAPNATIYSIKVLDSKGRGTEDNIITGINRAIELNVDIISMSLGGSIDYFSALHDSISYAAGKGIIIVAAAGNSAEIISTQPASWPGVISVEALREDKRIAAFTCLSGDISAEGTNITSLNYKNINKTSTKSGTSMACPFVAGCIALLLEAQPSLRGKPERVRSYLSSTGSFAPKTPKQINVLSFIPVTSNNYCYDTRDINPKTLVELELISDISRVLITDVRTQLLRNSGV